jgi:hypothetical protein
MNYKIELIKFYDSVQLNDMLDKICQNKRYRDDLKQDLILYLLTLDEKKLIRLIEDKELLFYSYGFLKNQFHSSSSEFFKTYRNFVTFEDGFDSQQNDFDMKDQNLIIKIDSLLNDKIDFFSAFLFRKYYYEWWSDEKEKTIKGRSYRKIEEEYSLNSEFKIDHMFIFNSVKDTMNIIKEELKKEGLI